MKHERTPAGGAGLIEEFLERLRVEDGVSPATVEAYRRMFDLVVKHEPAHSER